tara:strand:- start:611 stop:1144 length:534 start_codon:yes stop_codon:yes gene_type:complete
MENAMLCLDILSKINNVYTFIVNRYNSAMLTYFQYKYDNFIVTKIDTHDVGDDKICNVFYYYENKLYNKIYRQQTSNNKICIGYLLDIPNNNDIKQIIMAELVHTDNTVSIVIPDTLLSLIKKCAGPLQDFYDNENEYIYLNQEDIKLISDDIDIQKYLLHITYIDMSIIKKKIKII